MEPFNVPVVVSNLVTGASVTLDMVVDTGKMLPVIPAFVLRTIGVEPKVEEMVEVVHGTVLTIDRGEIHMTLEGQTVPVPCVFGPENVAPTLGWLVLETMSLKVDEEQRRLVSVVRRWIEHG